MKLQMFLLNMQFVEGSLPFQGLTLEHVTSLDKTNILSEEWNNHWKNYLKVHRTQHSLVHPRIKTYKWYKGYKVSYVRLKS